MTDQPSRMTARDIMTHNVTYCSTDTTAAAAARAMADQHIGSMPVCDDDGRLCGVITDRDLAVKIVAEGRDPDKTRLEDCVSASGVITVGANDPAEDVINTMKASALRRIPVIDGVALVGIISQADIARAMPDMAIGSLVESISTAPPNS